MAVKDAPTRKRNFCLLRSNDTCPQSLARTTTGMVKTTVHHRHSQMSTELAIALPGHDFSISLLFWFSSRTSLGFSNPYQRSLPSLPLVFGGGSRIRGMYTAAAALFDFERA